MLRLVTFLVYRLSNMTENAKTFVERRTFSVNEKTKLRFFEALCGLARSAEERLELIQLGDRLKQKLRDEFYPYDTQKMLGYLILIGVSKNEQRVRAISTNYRRAAVRQRKANSTLPSSADTA